MKYWSVVAFAIMVGLSACSPSGQGPTDKERAAALAESRAAIVEARRVVEKVEAGDPAAYAEANASLARAETALRKSERLSNQP